MSEIISIRGVLRAACGGTREKEVGLYQPAGHSACLYMLRSYTISPYQPHAALKQGKDTSSSLVVASIPSV